MLEVRAITDKDQWELFMSSQAERTFLNSWNWGEFCQAMGKKIWRIGIFERDECIGAALVSRVISKRGTYLLIQHGPSIKISNLLSEFTSFLRNLAQLEGCSFIRINPLLEASKEYYQFLASYGFRNAPMHANAYESTWKLDLIPSEEELFQNMRKTTRYLIRQTLKNKDIEIVKSVVPDDAKIFHELITKAAGKQHFTPFSKEFVENEFKVFSKENDALWIFGRYRGEPAACALIIFWSEIAFYHQAASDPLYAKLSIPYLIQWEAIKEAKKRGCTWYDCWGFTDPQQYPNHPWAGPTLFKMGFGGEKREYVKTQDLPLNWKYWVDFAVEKLRAKKRGY